MTETLDMPFPMLLTLIAIEQIKHEGAKMKRSGNASCDDEDVIPDIE